MTLASLLALNVFRTIGIVLALLIVGGFVVYAFINVRQGRAEVGSELELAANRKPYYGDDELETKVLDRSLSLGLVTLAVVGLGLPLYWLQEPSRQENSIGNFDRIFFDRGERLYNEGAQCNTCHGPEGVGGAANFTILDEETNDFVAQVQWQAPALDTAMLRYSEEEVTFILNYGRPFSPMPAWGGPGGGPLTSQQVEYLVEYLKGITIPAEEAQAAALEALEAELGSPADFITESGRIEAGEILFNLGRDNGFAGGAYACGRCHTQGWSYSSANGEPKVAEIDGVPQVGAGMFGDLVDRVSAPSGSGAYGPNLTNGATVRQFPLFEDHVEFIKVGTEDGRSYGRSGQGSGGMPGFGENVNTEESGDGMLTEDMIAAIVEYERSL